MRHLGIEAHCHSPLPAGAVLSHTPNIGPGGRKVPAAWLKAHGEGVSLHLTVVPFW